MQNLSLPSTLSKKLAQKYIGPYTIIRKIGEVAYKLELPPRLRIHPTVHVSLLKECVEDPNRSELVRPPPEVISGEAEYEVEAILDSRPRKRAGQTVGIEYLVKWQGYPINEATWLLEKDLASAREVLEEYWRSTTTTGGRQGDRNPRRRRVEK